MRRLGLILRKAMTETLLTPMMRNWGACGCPAVLASEFHDGLVARMRPEVRHQLCKMQNNILLKEEGALKMEDLKMEDRKMEDQILGEVSIFQLQFWPSEISGPVFSGPASSDCCVMVLLFQVLHFQSTQIIEYGRHFAVVLFWLHRCSTMSLADHSFCRSATFPYFHPRAFLPVSSSSTVDNPPSSSHSYVWNYLFTIF